jgi:hypothetical protein
MKPEIVSNPFGEVSNLINNPLTQIGLRKVKN